MILSVELLNLDKHTIVVMHINATHVIRIHLRTCSLFNRITPAFTNDNNTQKILSSNSNLFFCGTVTLCQYQHITHVQKVEITV